MVRMITATALAVLIAGAASAAASPESNGFLTKAAAAEQRGDTAAAVQLFQSAIIYAPADTQPYDQLAGFYARTGRPNLARKYYDLALQIDPQDRAARQGVTQIDQAAGDKSRTSAQGAQDTAAPKL
jgi:Flp pilus assembly protein TadD